MRTQVYKYELKPGPNKLSLPSGAELLCVGLQEDKVYLWARVAADEFTMDEDRLISLYGTGHEIKDVAFKYIGTVHGVQGWMVWHAFEEL